MRGEGGHGELRGRGVWARWARQGWGAEARTRAGAGVKGGAYHVARVGMANSSAWSWLEAMECTSG